MFLYSCGFLTLIFHKAVYSDAFGRGGTVYYRFAKHLLLKSKFHYAMLVRSWLRTCSKLVRAKFHYTSWFGASSELAPN